MNNESWRVFMAACHLPHNKIQTLHIYFHFQGKKIFVKSPPDLSPTFAAFLISTLMRFLTTLAWLTVNVDNGVTFFTKA